MPLAEIAQPVRLLPKVMSELATVSMYMRSGGTYSRVEAALRPPLLLNAVTVKR